MTGGADFVNVWPSYRPGSGGVRVHRGPGLLRGVTEGPSLAAHRMRYGELPHLSADELVAITTAIAMRGRGGAGFPFATKLTATIKASGRPVVVVNISEGEPASFKDAALALAAPHLILDGASVTARALKARTIHVVVPAEHPEVQSSVRAALAERRHRDHRVEWELHEATPGFVSGQARAVIELLSGRENLPVTSWQPEAICGYKGRPTLLSNAETFAHVGRLVALGVDRVQRHGTETEPGTTLLTIDGDGAYPQVVEVPYGTPWSDVLDQSRLAGPVLLGGYHGTWAAPGALLDLTVSRTELTECGLALGAGVVLPLAHHDCPVDRTSRIVSFLAGESAGRCGPCLNGLPALAVTMRQLSLGAPGIREAERLAGLVERRGACAHPDGTARLARSLIREFRDEIDTHSNGGCSYAAEMAADGIASMGGGR